MIHQRESDLDAEAPRLEIGPLGDAGLGLANLRQHLRIDEARDIEVGIVVAAQLRHRTDVVRVVEEADLRRAFAAFDSASAGGTAGGLNSGGSWMSAVRIGRAVAVEHHRRRQVAQRGLRREKLAKAVAVLVEQRLRARHVDRHGIRIGPN